MKFEIEITSKLNIDEVKHGLYDQLLIWQRYKAIKDFKIRAVEI